MQSVMTATGRVCTAHVLSDSDRGGWRVECGKHGRIASGYDTLGAAEDMAMRHIVKRDRIGR